MFPVMKGSRFEIAIPSICASQLEISKLSKAQICVLLERTHEIKEASYMLPRVVAAAIKILKLWNRVKEVNGYLGQIRRSESQASSS